MKKQQILTKTNRSTVCQRSSFRRTTSSEDHSLVPFQSRSTKHATKTR